MQTVRKNIQALAKQNVITNAGKASFSFFALNKLQPTTQGTKATTKVNNQNCVLRWI